TNRAAAAIPARGRGHPVGAPRLLDREEGRDHAEQWHDRQRYHRHAKRDGGTAIRRGEEDERKHEDPDARRMLERACRGCELGVLALETERGALERERGRPDPEEQERAEGQKRTLLRDKL